MSNVDISLVYSFMVVTGENSYILIEFKLKIIWCVII